MAIRYVPEEETATKKPAAVSPRVNSHPAPQPEKRELTQLRKQVAALQAEVTTLKAQLDERRGSHAEYMREYRKRQKAA